MSITKFCWLPYEFILGLASSSTPVTNINFHINRKMCVIWLQEWVIPTQRKKLSGTTQLNMIHRGWPRLITVQHGVYRGTLVYTNEIFLDFILTRSSSKIEKLTFHGLRHHFTALSQLCFTIKASSLKIFDFYRFYKKTLFLKCAYMLLFCSVRQVNVLFRCSIDRVCVQQTSLNRFYSVTILSPSCCRPIVILNVS